VSYDGGLFVGQSYDGDIDIDGIASERVTFKSDDRSPAAGDYYGLYLGPESAASRIAGLDMKHAGGTSSYPANIYMVNARATIKDSIISDSARYGIYLHNSTPTITNTEISNNAQYGVYCASDTCMDHKADAFSKNVVKGNKLYPVAAYADTIRSLAKSSTFSGNTNDYILARGGTVTKDATWHDLGVPYRMDTNVHVQHSVNEPILTIEDNVDMRFDSASGLYVGQSYAGDIDVDGHTKGVKMTSFRSRPAPGDWVGLSLHSRVGLDSRIDGLDISYGGYSGSYPGNLYVYSASNLKITDSSFTEGSRSGLYVNTTSSVEVTGSDFNDNDDFGVYMHNNAMLDDTFTGDEMTGNAWPMRLSSQQVHMLGTGNTFSGNDDDFIQVRYNGYINAHSTWSPMDVPYYAVENIYVGNVSSGATLTLKDGVDMRFANRTGMWVGYSSYNGDLVVNGDRVKGKGVTFSSFSGTGAGTWYGFMLWDPTSGLTKMKGFELREAGYSASWPGGLYIQNGDAVLSDCLIEDNERWGVNVYSSSGSSCSDVEISDLIIQDTTTTNKSTKPDGDGLHFNNTEYHQFFMDDVELTGNARYPVTLHANQMILMESETGGSDYTGTLKGDWCGVYFGRNTAVTCSLTSSTVSYGGKVGGCSYFGDYANIILHYSKATVSKNTISHSGKYGVRCWSTGHTLTSNTYTSNTSSDTYSCK
jgi:parallel beta-helix repeat protein